MGGRGEVVPTAFRADVPGFELVRGEAELLGHCVDVLIGDDHIAFPFAAVAAFLAFETGEQFGF